MITRMITASVAAVLLLLGVHAQAGTISLTPSTTGMIPGSSLAPPTSASNCEAGCVYRAFGLVDDGSLNLLYKADVGSSTSPDTVESGTFAASYSTVFGNTDFDPQDATVTWGDGLSSISCPDCYLAIKDGATAPTYYFFNLSLIPAGALSGGATGPVWNGKDTLALTGFWPDSGAISHVSIWGRTSEEPEEPDDPGTSVPVPGTLVLLGLGLLGLGWSRQRRLLA